MGQQQILKPQTNIPITGIVEYCDFIPTKNPQYSDQIALRGKWDGAGDARIYLHLNCEQDMQRLGIVGQRQQNGNYPMLVQAPRIKLCKVEQNGQKRTIIELIGHAGALAQQVQQYQQPAQAPQQVQGTLYNQQGQQQAYNQPSQMPQTQYGNPQQGQQNYPQPGYLAPPSQPAQPFFGSSPAAAQPSNAPNAAAPAATVAQVATTVPELVITFQDCLKLATKIVTDAGGTLEHHLPQMFATASSLFAVRCDLDRNLLGKTEFVPF